MSAGPAPEETAKAVHGRLPFTRLDWGIYAGLFLIALAVYVRTLAPDLLLGDSGEFQVLAVTGGLAHAFGYPVYLVIAKLFTFIPFRSVPERVSLVSAVFACSAVGKTYLVSRSLKVRRVYSLLAAFSLMISPLFWWQSIIAEVYTISADFLLGVILFAVIWRHTRNGWWLAASGLLGALCLGIHHAVLLCAPFALAYLIVSKARRSDWLFATSGIMGGVVLSAIAYAAMAVNNSPATASNYLRPVVTEYGIKSPSDLDSPMERAKFAFFAVQFRDNFQLEHVGPNVSWVKDEVHDDFGWLIPILGIIGIVSLLARSSQRREGVLVVGSYIALFAVPMFLSAFDLEVEFIQAHVLMCVLAAVGLQAIQSLVLRRNAFEVGPGLIAAGAAVLLLGFSAWPIITGVVPALKSSKPTFLVGDRRMFPYPVDSPSSIHDLAKVVISGVPDNSLLLINWADIDAFYYVALFEQNKPGIEVVAGFPNSPKDEASSQAILSFYEVSARTRPLFADEAPAALDVAFTQKPVLEGQKGRVYLYLLVPIDPRDRSRRE